MTNLEKIEASNLFRKSIGIFEVLENRLIFNILHQMEYLGLPLLLITSRSRLLQI